MAKDKIPETILQLLYPPRCIFCDEVVRPNEDCARCAATVDKLKIKGGERLTAGVVQKKVENLDAVVVSFNYTGVVAETVARYKFNGRPDLYRYMARYVAADVADTLDVGSIDVVMDVPSYKDKSDHARLLAKGVAKILDLPYDDKTLTKTRKTPKQHDQVYRMRHMNIQDAFGVEEGSDVKGKTVLVCDDVLTSGNTLNECAGALKAAGAAKVYGCAFSVTQAQQ